MHLTATTVTALAVFAVAGCGSEERAGSTKAADSKTTLEVVETDFAIEPATARVERPGAVRISVVNQGKAPHALAIDTSDGVRQTATLAAGESGEVKVELDDGTYTWYCPVGDHRAQGMEGKVVVGGADAATDSSDADQSRGSYGY